MQKFIVFAVFALAIFGAGVTIRSVADGISIRNPAVQPPDIDLAPLWRVWNLTKDRYVGRNDLDDSKLLEGAIKGLVDSLDDPYSTFLSAEEESEFEESLSGSFEGIGIEIGIRDDVLTVVAPIEGTPAKEAGLKAGDEILGIDGETTEGMTLEGAVSKIRGPKGNAVTLLIFREGWREPREFKITRAVIKVPSVTLDFPEPGIPVLKIHNFHGRALTEFRTAATRIAQSGARRMVIDLRDNPGGYLDYATNIAGWFLKRGSVVLKVDEGDGPEICNTCRAWGNQLFSNFKMVVLVNGGSASAAEILAGALRDNLGVPIVGTKTFGKGTVQEFMPIDENGALKLTVAKWLTPNGIDITKEGLTPGIVVEDKNGEDNEDPQLEKALELILSR